MTPNCMPRKTTTYRKVPIMADEIAALAARLDTAESRLDSLLDLVNTNRDNAKAAMEALIEWIDLEVAARER